MAGGGVGEAMLISAAVGGATSAATGGDPLKGALLGAAGGAAFGGLAGAAGGSATGATAGTAAGTTAGTAAGTAAGGASGATAGLQFATTPAEIAAATGGAAPIPLPTDPGIATQTLGPSGLERLAQTPSAIMDPALSGTGGVPGGQGVSAGLPSQNPLQKMISDITGTDMRPSIPNPQESRDTQKMFPKIAEFYAKNPIAAPAGIGAVSASLGSMPEPYKEPRYKGPLSRFKYDPDKYKRYAASGGLMETAPALRMMGGGHLGSYSDGGQLLKGREADSNGMNDDIPASIEGSQPALLADGEFVVPADVVSGLGNGSTEAGARQLYAMMDKVREARTGRTKQAPEINARKMMPA